MKAPQMTHKMGRKLETLERRAEFLAETIRIGRGSRESLDRYAGELSALDWAIGTIRAYYEHFDHE